MDSSIIANNSLIGVTAANIVIHLFSGTNMFVMHNLIMSGFFRNFAILKEY